MGNRLVSSLFNQISLLENQVSLLNQILALEKQMTALELKNNDLRRDFLKLKREEKTNTRLQTNGHERRCRTAIARAHHDSNTSFDSNVAIDDTDSQHSGFSNSSSERDEVDA